MSREPTVVKPQKAVHPSTAEAMERLKTKLKQDRENEERLREETMMSGDFHGIINEGLEDVPHWKPKRVPKARTGTTESRLTSTTEATIDDTTD